MAISACNVQTDEQGRELIQHGIPAFPIACYADELGNQEVPWHWHQELEAAWVLSGRCTLAVGKEKLVIGPGEGFFVNASVLHGLWDLDASGCQLRSIVFHPRLVGGSPDSVFYSRYLQPLLERKDLEFLRLDPREPWQQEFLELLNSSWSHCLQEPSGYEFLVRQDLSQMLLLLHSHLAPAPANISPRQQLESDRVKAMLSYIHEHYAQELTVQHIARSAMLSVSQCLRCFHSTIGTTPIQYLRQYRLQQAAQRLTQSQDKIADIAFGCGFQDMSYFTRVFRQEKGCTPSQYRHRATQA